MRFRKYGRVAFADTARKRAAAEIGEGQPAVDAVMADRARIWKNLERAQRNRRAADWRRARARLRAYPAAAAAVLLAKWNSCRWPGDPVYLLSMMHMYDTGRLEDVAAAVAAPAGGAMSGATSVAATLAAWRGDGR